MSYQTIKLAEETLKTLDTELLMQVTTGTHDFVVNPVAGQLSEEFLSAVKRAYQASQEAQMALNKLRPYF